MVLKARKVLRHLYACAERAERRLSNHAGATSHEPTYSEVGSRTASFGGFSGSHFACESDTVSKMKLGAHRALVQLRL